MYHTTAILIERLKSRKIVFKAGTLSHKSTNAEGAEQTIQHEVVDIKSKGSHGLMMELRFVFDNSEQIATVSALNYAKVPERKLDQALKLVNEFNINCRMAKYILVPAKDNDGTPLWIMTCRIDLNFTKDASDVADLCEQAIRYLSIIVNKDYPHMMQILFDLDVTGLE